MADADTHTPIVLCAECRRNVFETVVTATRATFLELAKTRCDIEFVVHHQNLIRCDFVKTADRSDRLTLNDSYTVCGCNNHSSSPANAGLGHQSVGSYRVASPSSPTDRPAKTRIVAGFVHIQARIAGPTINLMLIKCECSIFLDSLL